MEIIKEELLKAINYAADSPYVKVAADNSNQSECIKDAMKISREMALSSTVKKRLSDVLSMLKSAQENCLDMQEMLFQETLNSIREMTVEVCEIQEEIKSITQQKDEGFIKSLKEENEQLKKDKENEFVRRLDEEVRNRKKKKSTYIKLLLLIPLGIILLSIIGTGFIDSMAKAANNNIVVVAFLSVVSIFGGLACMIFGVIAFITLVSGYKNTPEDVVNKSITDYYKKTDEKIENNIKKIEKGIDPNSEFAKNLLKQISILNVKQENIVKEAKHLEFMSKSFLCDDFSHGIELLEQVIENFDSINAWAMNIVQNHKQDMHNANLEYIEREKLREQRNFNYQKEQEIYKQNELLRRQAEAAEENARAAERQADDTAEIRRRMEMENIGSQYKPENF